MIDRTPIGWPSWLLIAASCFLTGAVSTAAEVMLQSTPLGTIGKLGGTSVTAVHFSGWRFSIDTPLAVERVGGHLLGDLAPGQVFAALVALDSIDAMPHGSPFTPEEVVATALLQPQFPSDEVSVPLSATLLPGSYALVFGSGLFSAEGEAALPLLDDQPDIPPTTISSYIFWSIPSQGQPPEWRTNLASRMRFVVAGQEIRLPGDYNLDGSVNENDYGLWQASFGATGPSDVDGNGNNVVDAADFAIWRDHLGNGVNESISASSVPEPATCTIAIVTLALAATRKLPRRRVPLASAGALAESPSRSASPLKSTPT